MNNSLISNQLQKDRLNEVSARPYSNDSGNRLPIYAGKIKVVNSNSSYKVAVMGSDGVTELAEYDGVIVLGAEVEKSVDEIVVLVFTTKDYPYILNAGGGGSGNCRIPLNSFGVLYG